MLWLGHCLASIVNKVESLRLDLMCICETIRACLVLKQRENAANPEFVGESDLNFHGILSLAGEKALKQHQVQGTAECGRA